MAEREKLVHHIQPRQLHQLHEEHVRRVEQSAGIVESIPVGYTGPAVWNIGGFKIPVYVDVYHGLEEVSSRDKDSGKEKFIKKHLYGLRLRIDEVKSRVEGPQKGDDLYATPKDINTFNDRKQQDPQVLIDLSKQK